MRKSTRLATKKLSDEKKIDGSQNPSLEPGNKPPAKKRSSGKSKVTGDTANKQSKPSVPRSREASVTRKSQEASTSRNVAPGYTDVLNYEAIASQIKQYSAITIDCIKNDPVHPDVRLKKLPFYEELGELIKPTNIIASLTEPPLLENQLMFFLTPKQTDTIAESYYCQPGSDKMNYSVQVIMRFCLQETFYEQNDRIPPLVRIKVNGKNLNVPQANYFNAHNKPKELPMKPIDITPLVHFSAVVANRIAIAWPFDSGRKYVAGVYLARKLTSYELTNQLKAKCLRNADYTRVMIKEKLVEETDCEIATTSLRVSLNCPLGKMRMGIPCRASTCTHFQCFDAALYLQMNDCRPMWVCPVCNQPAPYDCLVIDGYFQQVLTSDKLLANVTEVQLLPDGSWENLAPNKDRGKMKSGKSEVMSVANSTIILDASPVKDKNEAEKKEKNISIIDLISSDDDDVEVTN